LHPAQFAVVGQVEVEGDRQGQPAEIALTSLISR
jgi:hypothetical protein